MDNVDKFIVPNIVFWYDGKTYCTEYVITNIGESDELYLSWIGSTFRFAVYKNDKWSNSRKLYELFKTNIFYKLTYHPKFKNNKQLYDMFNSTDLESRKLVIAIIENE